MVYFHKFIFSKKPEIFKNDLEKYILSITLIFLAAKSSNILIELESLVKITINIFLSELNELNKENIKNEIKEKVFMVEYEILNAIGFDLNVDLPYNYLMRMKSNFEHYPKFIFDYCIWFINDSFILPVCLNVYPHLIALSSIYLLNQKLNLNLIDKIEEFKDIDLNEVKRISGLLSKIYNKSSPKKIENKINKLPMKEVKLNKLYENYK